MGAAIEQSSVFHLQGDRVSPEVLKQREDLLGTTSASSLVYCSLDGWRRQMAEQGQELLEAARQRAFRVRAALHDLAGLSVMGEEVVGPGMAFELDPLKITIDVRDLGIHGMQAAEWLRAHRQVDVGASDTFRMTAHFTHADDDDTERILVEAMAKLVDHAAEIERPPAVEIPSPHGLELEQARLPRDAFFGPAEHVPADKAAGRIAAEMLSPYPPGVPAVAPGEVITTEVVDYLRSGLAAGVLIPDASDSSLETIRVLVD
jgi:arginine decarboxylase